MHTQARVVIIGGGIVGCSTAYHLTRLGWRDVLVLDQGPLFHNIGSTSHAPGLMFQHNNSKTVCQLARWSVELYKEVQPTDERAFWQVGSLEIANTAARWEELKRKIGNCLSWGLEAHLIGPAEIAAMIPLMRTDDLYGAFYVPTDCDVTAWKICEALAKRAEANGATFYPSTTVTDIEVKKQRVQAVVTDHGRIETEHIVCAAGLWGPLIGRMAGVEIPLSPMQHLYVRTEPWPELAGETEDVRHPIVREQDQDLYYRQHKDAYGFGTYRHDPLPVYPDDLPRHDHPAIFDFTPQHCEVSSRDAMHRFPCLERAAIAHRFNGLFSFTPDLNSVVGEHPDVRGFWSAEAVWVTHGGGTGRVVAEWMVDGRPSIDLRELDINRFHPHAFSKRYIRERACQQYVEVYDIIHPAAQIAQPRGLRVSPFYPRQRGLGATFFESAGWERPQWYEANGALLNGGVIHEREGWRAENWSPIIGAEHRAARERVGLFDLTAFAKFEISGPGALDFLQRLAANQMDRPIGKVTYTAMLDDNGGIVCDLTVTRLAPDRFWVVTGGAMGLHDLAWLRFHLPTDGSVHIDDVSSRYCCIGVWGPHAREVVQSVSENDISNAPFPYLTAQRIFVGMVPALAVRISYAGELGWEIYAPTEYGLQLWDTLWKAGQHYGIAAVGNGAFDSLRLEKGYRLWGNEIHTEYNPFEAGLGFAVRLNKGDFIGQAACERIQAQGISRQLCCMTFDEPQTVVLGKEPILSGDTVLGYVTSSNYGYTIGRGIAYGYLPLHYARPGTAVEIYFFGERYKATVADEPLYDPDNARLKS
jgi:glycine cleavage system T protein